MKTIKLLAVSFLIVLVNNSVFAATSDKWDDEITKTYDVGNFTRLYLEGGYKVILEQSDRPGLKIKADEEAFEYIDVDSSDASLKLRITKTHFDFERLTLYISFVNLDEIEINGGAKLETRGYLDLDDIYIHVEGAAKIEMEMKANRIDVVGEGGVSYEFRGVCNSLDARISGAGYLDAEELISSDVTFRIEGVGAGAVYATETLSATIDGVGKIKYKGNPKVDKLINGIGIVSSD